MQIQIEAFATLSRYAPSSGYLEIPSGATPRDVIRKLGIPEEDVSIVFVNGRHAGLDAQLQEEDRMGVFPPIGGGWTHVPRPFCPGSPGG